MHKQHKNPLAAKWPNKCCWLYIKESEILVCPSCPVLPVLDNPDSKTYDSWTCCHTPHSVTLKGCIKGWFPHYIWRHMHVNIFTSALTLQGFLKTLCCKVKQAWKSNSNRLPFDILYKVTPSGSDFSHDPPAHPSAPPAAVLVEPDPQFKSLLPAAPSPLSSNTTLKREWLRAFPSNSLLRCFNVIIGNIFLPSQDLKTKPTSLIIFENPHWAESFLDQKSEWQKRKKNI